MEGAWLRTQQQNAGMPAIAWTLFTSEMAAAAIPTAVGPPDSVGKSRNSRETRGCIQRETWCMGPYAGVDYNLTLCPLQHMYHGRPYARVDLNPLLESTLSSSQGLRIWSQQHAGGPPDARDARNHPLSQKPGTEADNS
jgi:hypothetical protein